MQHQRHRDAGKGRGIDGTVADHAVDPVSRGGGDGERGEPAEADAADPARLLRPRAQRGDGGNHLLHRARRGQRRRERDIALLGIAVGKRAQVVAEQHEAGAGALRGPGEMAASDGGRVGIFFPYSQNGEWVA